jgi:hypothetical protein
MNSLTKIIVVSLAAFAAVIVLVMFLAKPILGQIDTLHQKEAAQRSELDALNTQLTAYNEAKAQLREVNYKELIDGAILERESLGEVLVEIESYAAKTNVTESIKISDDQLPTGNSKDRVKTVIPGERDISEVSYTLSFNSTFPDSLNFMQYLEHLSHFTEISGLTFGAASAQGSSDVSVHTNIVTGTISGVFLIKKK